MPINLALIAAALLAGAGIAESDIPRAVIGVLDLATNGGAA